ncbi:MAG: ParB/RepB/Spo0J family partition protein [Candidatus Jordarchaeum sp.]|uniref:ParB/RepB/Spo0J family partition protein n=1 Tax=Candidatus Jordarchaeum sp. TaxID=2823881 RepID=UPI00404B7D3F
MIKRIRVDPKKVKRFSLKVGDSEYDIYGTPRHKYDWTKSEGPNSGWANIEGLAQSIRRDGLIHTPLVCSFHKFGYEEDLIAVQGWRRIRASILNKYDYIEVDYTDDLSPMEAEILSFKENYNREQLSDSEISFFLSKIRKRHPDWTYEKIGEIFGIGGESPGSKRKAVESYLSHFDFLERHAKDVQRLDISLKKLTRKIIMQIRSTAREIAGEELREDYETKILEAYSETKGIPLGLLCNTLRSEHRRGNSVSPMEAVELIRKSGVLLSEGKKGNKCYVNLFIPPEIASALKKYESKITKTKRNHLGKIILDIVQSFLKKEGYY